MTSLSTLCYIEQDGKYLMLHRTVKKNDVNKDKWIGVGGHFEPDESPEECLLREVREETGYTLTAWRYRGLVTFISGGGVTEYMSLFTADGFTGEPIPCDEGELAWVDQDEVLTLNIWEGDKIFFRLLKEHESFFSLKLVYDGGDRLVGASLDGRPMELFEVLDEQGEKTGVLRERNVVHRDGSPHATAHVWIVRENDRSGFDILLQKRSQDKDSYPGCYDISSAGHIPAGEGALTCALRELSEELGIAAEPGQLEFVGIRHASFASVFHGKPFRDNEFSRMFLYRGPVDVSALRLQPEEVESVRWMDFSECMDAVRAGTLKSCLYVDELEMLGNALGFTFPAGYRSQESN